MNYKSPTPKQQQLIQSLKAQLQLTHEQYFECLEECGLTEPKWGGGVQQKQYPSRRDASRLIEYLLKLKADRIGNQTNK